MENKDQMLVTMTKEELDNLIYFTTLRSTKRALDSHFRGLLPFLNLINDNQETMLSLLEYIKLTLQNRNISENEEQVE